MRTEFVVRVTIEGDPEDAYGRLADLLNPPETSVLVWGMETYSVDGGPHKDTEDLFIGPKEE